MTQIIIPRWYILVWRIQIATAGWVFIVGCGNDTAGGEELGEADAFLLCHAFLLGDNVLGPGGQQLGLLWGKVLRV